MASTFWIYHLHSPSVGSRVHAPVFWILIPNDFVVGRAGRFDACNNSRVSVARIGKRDRSLIRVPGARNGGLSPWAGNRATGGSVKVDPSGRTVLRRKSDDDTGDYCRGEITDNLFQ